MDNTFIDSSSNYIESAIVPVRVELLHSQYNLRIEIRTENATSWVNITGFIVDELVCLNQKSHLYPVRWSL